MIHTAGVPLTETIRMMTLNPARIMKADKHKGSVAIGKDADIVIFDEDITIQSSIVGGEILYSKL